MCELSPHSILCGTTCYEYFDTILTSPLVDNLLIVCWIFLLAQLKIEEITRMLRTGELGIPDNPDERYIIYFSVNKNCCCLLLVYIEKIA